MNIFRKLNIVILLLICIFSFGYCDTEPNLVDPGQLIWTITEKDYDIGNDGGDMAIVGDKLIEKKLNRTIAINKHTVKILWTTKGFFQRTPVIVNNKIFNVSPDGKLIFTVLDLNGKLLNDQTPSDIYEGNIVDAVPTHKDNKIYFVVSYTGKAGRMVISVNINTYEINEVYKFDGLFSGRLVIKDNLLYIPYKGAVNPKYGGIIAYNLDTNTVEWKRSFDYVTGGRDILDHNPIIYENKLYVGITSDISVLDCKTGEEVNFFDGQGYNGMSVGNDILFLPSWRRAIDLKAETELWTRGTYSTDSGSVYRNGVFYMMAYGLMAMDCKTGKDLLPHTFYHDETKEEPWQYDDTSHMPLLYSSHYKNELKMSLL